LPNDSEPQPDLSILRWRSDFYRQSHPQPADVILLIEVADTSSRYDRDVKIPLYARHGIAEVWLVDLPKRQVEVCRQPEQGEYRQVQVCSQGRLSPAQLPEVTIDMVQLFPVADGR